MAAKYFSIYQIKDDSTKLRFEEPGVGKSYRHIHCEMLPHKVKHSVHLHELTLHPPLIESDWHFEFFCDACEKDRDRASIVYYCEPCKFVAHIGCGVCGSEPPPIQNILGSDPHYLLLTEVPDKEEKVEETNEGDDVYGKGDKICNIFHEHPLSLKYSKRLVWLRGKKCSACGQHIFGITYAFTKESCDFYLHKWCVQLQKAIDYSMHSHHGSLKLVGSLNDNFTFVKELVHGLNDLCTCCGMYIELVPYVCRVCDFQIHGLCALLLDDLKHQSHEHMLTAVINMGIVQREGDILKLPSRSSKNPLCQACGFCLPVGFVECKSCDFHMHIHCFLVPYIGKHTTHKHDLRLTYSYEEDPTALEFFCDTCEKPRMPNRWVYCCPVLNCYIVSHVDCVVTEYFTHLLPPNDTNNHEPPFKNSSEDQAPSTSNLALTQMGTQYPNQNNINSEFDLWRVLFPSLFEAPAPADVSTSTVVEEADLNN